MSHMSHLLKIFWLIKIILIQWRIQKAPASGFLELQTSFCEARKENLDILPPASEVTTRIRRMGKVKVLFSVCSSLGWGGWGPQVTSPLPSLGSHVPSGGYPSLWFHVPSAGYPSLRSHVPSRGYSQDWPTPWPGPPPPLTANAAGGTPGVACCLFIYALPCF